MNFLPSMLLATTLIGGSCNIQANMSGLDMNSLQNLCKENSVNCQVYVGNWCDLESILDCFRPSAPGSGDATEIPDTKPETPDAELPGNKPETPGNDSSVNNGQEGEKSYVEQVVALVNIERAKAGLPALTMSEDLNRAAQIRAKEIVQSFSHTRPNGSSFSSVLKENGISYRGAGENIAWGQRTPEAVVNAWMNSAGHRANILNKNYTTIGVGYYLDGTTPYWAQLFTY